MSISYQALGAPGRDNAAFVRIDTGQTIHRLLFDCGDGCLADLPLAEVQAIDDLLFSHLHMDHVGGFDALFRATYNRASKPIEVWGPPETGRILHHRFRGFLWNLYQGQPGTWYVHDISSDRRDCARFEAGEAFVTAHPCPSQVPRGPLIDAPAFSVEALEMDHGTPSLAYIVREKPRLNVDTARLAALGLPPGPWLQRVKEPRPGEEPTIEIGGVRHDLARLREALLIATPGDSLAYLTDFRLDDAARERLTQALQGCATMICESQYRDADAALATRNYHMTAAQAADLARRAGVGRLILFHLSDRYRANEWQELLGEARAIFPNTHFPAHWQI
jgi:ribonuclease Z